MLTLTIGLIGTTVASQSAGTGWGLLAPWASVRSAYQGTLVSWCDEQRESRLGTSSFRIVRQKLGPDNLIILVRAQCGSMSIIDRWIQGGVLDCTLLDLVIRLDCNSFILSVTGLAQVEQIPIS